MKVIVYHSSYGCDTGCCGHTVELPDGREKFTFDHPYSAKTDEELKAWATEIAQRILKDEFGIEHTVDLDWENCRVTDNC